VIFDTFSIFFLINSTILIALILNQNESAKDNTSFSTENEISNPLQNVTWVCVISEFLFFLIKSKITDF
jgi:preprotein translocase subunit SecG